MALLVCIDTRISRLISRRIKNNSSYEPWLKPFISPKDYYKIRESSLLTLQNNSFMSLVLHELCKTYSITEIQTIELMIQCTNRLTITLFYIKYISRIKSYREKAVLFFEAILLYVRLKKAFSTSNLSFSMLVNSAQDGNLHLLAPICPDYSHERNPDGTYSYTFQGVGEGIGVVAQKAIQNIKIISQISADFLKLSFRPTFLIGDFEAKPDNLARLGENKTSFFSKLSNSCKAITNLTGYESILFTSLCAGFENWLALESSYKHIHGLKDFESLHDKYPKHAHDKNLISRVPLYRRWFGDDACMKNKFLEQSIEYMLMGNLIESFYGSNSIILASDHKVMRSYYGLGTSLAIVGTSAQY